MTSLAVPVLLALAAVVVGCAPAPNATTGSTSTPTVAPSHAETLASTAAPTIAARPSPLTSSVGVPTSATAAPTAEVAVWAGIKWRKLAIDDPLAQLVSIVRWRGGFVGLGTVVASGDKSRTPVWVSSDGRAWRQLDADVFGPSTLVLGIGETPDGIVALTLQGGANQCDGQSTPLNCWLPQAPLQSWTSFDAASWTPHPGPAGISMPETGCDSCGVAVPIVRSGIPGILAVNVSGSTAPAGSGVALSRDGIAWESLPADAYPAAFELHDVAAFGSGFVASGEQNVTIDGEETVRGVVLSSSDGRIWVAGDLPHPAAFDPRLGSGAPALVVGPGGLIAAGGDGIMSTVEVWWSSVSGRTWSRLAGYPPLGVDANAEAGSRVNGELLGDGERLVAYRGGAKPVAWTSANGRSWRKITVGGSRPTGSGTLLLVPIGVMWIGDDGSRWFGVPVA